MRIIHPFFLSIFLILTVQLLHAQIVTITDEESGEPLELVTLISQSPRAMALSNAQGQVDISEFVGSEIIEVRKLGYQTLRMSFADIGDQNFLLELAPSNINLQQVVVSATRWLQPSQDTPVKISSLSQKDVALENPSTTADLLGSSGEVYIQKSQLGGGSPIIRGFSANRLLYVVDGIRMNTAIFRSGNLQNVISLDAFSLERTEILFGPGSVMYGSDAIGAVMSFQTLSPQYSLNDKVLSSGRAVGRYAQASNEKTGHMDVHLGWKKWALVTSFTASDFGDLKMGSNGPDDYLRPFYVRRTNGEDLVIANSDPEMQTPTGYQQLNFMQKVGYRPNNKWEFDYGFHYSKSSDVPRYDRLTITKNDLPKSAEWYYGPQKWIMNNLSIISRSKTKLFDELNIRLAHQYFEESRFDRDFNSIIRSERTEQVNALSANIDFAKTPNNISSFFYGFEFVSNDVVSTGLETNIETDFSEVGPSRYPNATWLSYGAYLTYQRQLHEKVRLNSGLRMSGFDLASDYSNNQDFYPLPFTSSTLNDGGLTGSLGLTYRPDETWSINTQFSTAYRAPNVDDSGKIFDSEPGIVVVPNPELEAEYAYNAEIGIAKVFGEIIKIDVTSYYTFLDNAMVRRPYELNGLDSIIYEGELSQVQAVQNAAQVLVYGLQAGFEFKLPHGFSISSRYNVQVGEEELEDGSTSPSRHAAPWFGTTKIHFYHNKLELQLSCDYSKEIGFEELPESEKGKSYLYASDSDGNPYAPQWYSVDAKALFHMSKMLSFSAGIDNITNQRYRTYSSGIAAPGRNFYFALTGKF